MHLVDTSSDTARWRHMQLVYAGFVGSCLIYAGICWYILAPQPQPPLLSPPATELPLLLTGAGLLLVLAAPVLEGQLARPRGATPGPLPEGASSAYLQASLAAGVLREAAAILGMVLTLVTRELRWMLGLGAAAVLALLLGWPSRARMARLAHP